jgi:hypothetical protein
MRTTADGFLRMTLEDVLSLPFIHLTSGIDEHFDDSIDKCGSRTIISGYTEWIAANAAVTVGWDWIIEAEQWIRVGPPRSNVLLVDRTDHAYDWAKNEAVLSTVVDAIPWQEQASAAIGRRYA